MSSPDYLLLKSKIKCKEKNEKKRKEKSKKKKKKKRKKKKKKFVDRKPQLLCARCFGSSECWWKVTQPWPRLPITGLASSSVSRTLKRDAGAVREGEQAHFSFLSGREKKKKKEDTVVQSKDPIHTAHRHAHKTRQQICCKDPVKLSSDSYSFFFFFLFNFLFFLFFVWEEKY